MATTDDEDAVAIKGFTANQVVLQPTAFCNLDCDYCYLPDRSSTARMSASVARQVAEFIRTSDHTVALIWHGGEPLATGIEHFRLLLDQFSCLAPGTCRHEIQTNATLITPSWCDLFLEYGFHVGVSVDGPDHLNRRRVDRRGHQTHDRFQRGVDQLRMKGIPFAVIAVVGEASLDYGGELFEYAVSLGAETLCINIEETEGAHVSTLASDAQVQRFWADLYRTWRKTPVLRVREFDQKLSALNQALQYPTGAPIGTIELIPTISTNGSVCILSPELLGHNGGLYDFTIGNILDTPLELLLRAPRRYGYVDDYLAGVRRCKTTCEYFAYCGGGHASNKFFENGTVNSTSTRICRYREMLLVEAILQEMDP